MTKLMYCPACENRFHTDDEIPECNICENNRCYEFYNDDLIKLEEGNMEEHHIHPRFMDNPHGLGQKFMVSRKKHMMLHGYITKWIWEIIPEEYKEKIIKEIIRKSKIFIGVGYDTK